MRVLRSTLEMLERLRDKFKVGNPHEARQLRVMRQRKKVIDEAFGADKSRIKPLTEEDRSEDRD